MISCYLNDEEMTAYLKKLKAGRKSLDAQNKALLDALFFYQDEDGAPDYDWNRIAEDFQRSSRGKVCTAEDVLPPALYPAFDLMMGAELRADLVDIVQRLPDYPYTRGFYRRLIRSRDYHQHVERLWRLIEKLICQHVTGLRAAQLLRSDYDREQYGRDILLPEQVALWLDRGNAQVISIVRDMLLSENNTNILSYEVLCAIFQSRNAEFVELVGKLLLAGKLQEGLRQAICETMDCGRQEHFAYMMELIAEHDLIRFSSVRRAIATTIGVSGTYSDRVDKKQLALMLRVLQNPQEADALIESADNVEAMVGLWSKGSRDLKELIAGMEHMIEGGKPHSVLLVSYYLNVIQDEAYARRTAKRVLAGITNAVPDAEDMKCVACYLPFVTGNFRIWDAEEFTKTFDPSEYFESTEEAAAFFDLCERAMDQMKRKEIEYRPCIFPWYGVTLRKESLAGAMILAALCADGTLTDRVAPVLSVAWIGAQAAEILLAVPRTAVQEAALVDLLRTAPDTAKDILAKNKLISRHHTNISALLRLKNPQTRRAVLDLLYMQEDAPLYATIAELLAQKDVNKRLGGLDLLLRCKADGRIAQEELLSLAHGIQKPTSDEQVLIDELTGETNADEQERALYDASYTPDFKIEITEAENADGVTGGCDAAAHTDYGSEETTLSAGFHEAASEPAAGIDAPLCRYPLAEVWEDFYKREIRDFATLYQLAIALRMPRAEGALFTEALDRITERDWTALPDVLAAKKLNYFGDGYGGQTSGREVIRILYVTHAHKNQAFVFAAGLLLMSRAYECFD